MKKERLFTNRQLLTLLWPLIIEQMLEILVGMADTVMVSSVGEAAISGVSLVDMINQLIITLFGALATGGIFLILCGLVPKLGALVSIMPQSVLGGAAVMMFSSIVVSGIQLITREPLTPRSLSIVSVALGLGYGIGANNGILAHAPQMLSLVFGGSGIVPAALVAILLNLAIPKDENG